MIREPSAITVSDITQALVERRWLCAGVVAVCILGGVVFAFFSTKYYRAEVTLAPNREVASDMGAESMLGSLSSIASLSGFLDSGESITNEAVATLRSRAFLQKFIEEEDLLRLLYKKDWDSERHEWKPGLQRIPTAGRAWKMFRDDMLRIEEVRGNDLYTVSVEWSDPELPSVWLASLIRRLNEEMRGRQKKEADDVLQFLTAQIEKTASVEVKAALYKLTEAQLRRVAIASVRQDYAFRIIDPPFASDVDQFVRPRRVILIALSIVLGLTVAVMIALVAPRKRIDA